MVANLKTQKKDFSQNVKYQKLTQEKVENLNKSVIIEEIRKVMRFDVEKASG